MTSAPQRKKLIFEGSPEVLAALQELMRSGELDRRLGVSVIDLRWPKAGRRPSHPLPAPPIDLGEWLLGEITTGWQTLNSLLNPERALALMPRTITESESAPVSAGWVLDVNDQEPVALVVTVQGGAEEARSHQIALHPTGDLPYVPEGLGLVMRSQTQTILQSVHTEGQDNYIQLNRVQAQRGTPFLLEITLHGTPIASHSFLA